MESKFSRCCFLCLVLFGFTANAQQQWSIAKLVTADSDTIHGEILFEDWVKSPSSIQFKNTNGSTTNYPAKDIKSIYINKPVKQFASKPLALSYYNKNVVAEGTSPIAKTDSVTLLIEVLLEGPAVKLYECMDEQGQARFFLEKDNHLHELRNPSYRLAKGENIHVIHKEIYKEQLKQLLSECPSLKTNRVKYSDVDLVDLLLEYHRYCKVDVNTEFEQKALGERVSFGGTFRSFPQFEEVPTFVGLSMNVFSKKKFNSAFFSIDAGIGFAMRRDVFEGDDSDIFYVGLYGGKYFGLGTWRPVIYTGISNIIGPFDTGVGLAYKKFATVSLSSGLYMLTKGVSNWSYQIKVTPFPIKAKSR